jgi:hypothetical protein
LLSAFLIGVLLFNKREKKKNMKGGKEKYMAKERVKITITTERNEWFGAMDKSRTI